MKLTFLTKPALSRDPSLSFLLQTKISAMLGEPLFGSEYYTGATEDSPRFIACPTILKSSIFIVNSDSVNV
jgi:hypothetical protein